MTTNVGGVVVKEGAEADRAIQLDEGEVLVGKGIGEDPEPTNMTSGTYTPTISNLVNLTSATAAVCRYTRIGSVVTVSGQLTLDPTTTATLTSCDLTLPVASTLTNANQASGVGASATVAAEAIGIIGVASSATVRLSWVATNVASMSVPFSFTYQVN